MNRKKKRSTESLITKLRESSSDSLSMEKIQIHKKTKTKTTKDHQKILIFEEFLEQGVDM